MLQSRWTIASVVALALASSAHASDGVLEINQTCALSAAGCFAGDSGGSFPVTITQAHTSYRLTSSLQVPNQNTTAIAVTPFGANVSIDLNGFSIRGVTLCSAGGGQPAVCSPRGSGVGIDGQGGLRIRDGFVTNMGSHGIALVSGQVEDIVVFMNGGDGVHGSEAVSLRGVEAMWNHEDGIDISISGIVMDCVANGNGFNGVLLIRGRVSNCLSERNGGYGMSLGATAAHAANTVTENVAGSVSGGRATGGSLCDGSDCSRTGARRYFLSIATADGASAPFVCSNAIGFHMASVFELLDPSHLVYDTARGLTLANTGGGPPSDATNSLGPVAGWLRDGLVASIGSNCSAHTSASINHRGSLAALSRDGVFGFAGSGAEAATWGLHTDTCDIPHKVWCIED